MEIIVLLVVLVIIVAVFFSIGLVLRERPRWLQIGVTTTIAAVVFLSIAMVGSGIGIGIYSFYQFKACPNSTATCAAEQDFNTQVPRLTLWMTIPKPFRASCETVSKEFCLLEKSFDMAPYNYIAAAFGAVIVIFLIGQGMRQKDEEMPLKESLPT